MGGPVQNILRDSSAVYQQTHIPVAWGQAPTEKDSSSGTGLEVLDRGIEIGTGIGRGANALRKVAVNNLTMGEICAGYAIATLGYMGFKSTEKLTKLTLLAPAILGFLQLSYAVITRKGRTDENFYVENNYATDAKYSATRFNSFWNVLFNFNPGWSLKDLFPVFSSAGAMAAICIWGMGLARLGISVNTMMNGWKKASETVGYKPDDWWVAIRSAVGIGASLISAIGSVKLANLLASQANNKSVFVKHTTSDAKVKEIENSGQGVTKVNDEGSIIARDGWAVAAMYDDNIEQADAYYKRLKSKLCVIRKEKEKVHLATGSFASAEQLGMFIDFMKKHGYEFQKTPKGEYPALQDDKGRYFAIYNQKVESVEEANDAGTAIVKKMMGGDIEERNIATNESEKWEQAVYFGKDDYAQQLQDLIKSGAFKN